MGRFGWSATVIFFALGAILAAFEVQGVIIPQPLFIFIIVIMLLMVFVAVGVILYEIGKAARRFWQQRSVSATWVSAEEPGLLDFEVDLEKGTHRLISELNKLTNDTQKLGKQLPKHQERIQKAAKSSDPHKKQKRANQAAKDIGRSAVFISRRRDLLDVLVNEVHRNGEGIVSAMNFGQKDATESGRSLQKTLDENVDITKATIASLSKYRNAAKGVRDRNLSRTIRVESNRLMESLEHMLKTLRRYNTNSQQLKNMLNKMMPPNQNE